jgi:hypothetical protein
MLLIAVVDTVGACFAGDITPRRHENSEKQLGNFQPNKQVSSDMFRFCANLPRKKDF